ncbi:hypothetical protein IAI10_05300 [Clostridium sp. 19966]|uniref:DUF5677 domain-containing protein n=1 Tax=Clostridium sp. 19966 TaxID=2768166 RepID=UPI0028DF6DC6|nr:DUF5677 domain-containing protein [Clostridium sp. 19966]MDT8716062.1 hypothetical protein [Clostridium sp. 19966]
MIRDNYGNCVYELTGEEKELITEHKLFYDDLFKYLNAVLDNGFDETIKDFELTIYSNIYRIVELLDTLKVMTENSLINSGFIILRSLIESAVQLCYILLDDAKIEKRATILQMLDIKRTAVDEDDFYKRMDQIECYKSYVEVIKRDKPYPNWYSYCEDKRTTLENLFNLIGWEKIYSDIYRPLCIETHEINHMETNIAFGGGKFNFKPLRMFENHVLLLNSVLTVMAPLLNRLVYMYGNDKIKNDWNEYEVKVKQYIKSNHSITEIEKIFNPSVKWF